MKTTAALIGALAWLALGTAHAQEAEEADADEDSEEVEAPEDAIFDDDIFKPSEIIEADSEISFPADI